MMTGHIAVHHWNEGAGRRIGQKTFVSTCHFQPKRVPVRYTETLIMNLNSTKRKYYESVSYETKMVPSNWSQTMYVDLVPGEDRIVNEVHIPCENYISLIPQQVIAQTENNSNPETKIERKENIDKQNDANQTNHNSVKNIPVNNHSKHRAGRTEFNDTYYKSTCQQFLDELRKMY